MRITLPSLLLATHLLVLPALGLTQELEPRRWSHLPVGANFFSAGYAYTDKDILLDPALQIEDARGEIHTLVLGYVRALDVFGKSGRIDVVLPYSNGRWDGLLEGMPASTRRSGFNDPSVRFAVNFYGSPAQRGAAFRAYKVKTIVGAAVEVTMPLGQYNEDRLINLGNNRWVVRPQLGAVTNFGKWSAELTGSVWFYTENDDFFEDEDRDQNPLYSVQTHLIYTFRPGLWMSGSLGYGNGGQSRVGGVRTDDRIDKILYALSFGLPITAKQGLKFSYINGTTQADRGDDYDRFLIVYSVLWGG